MSKEKTLTSLVAKEQIAKSINNLQEKNLDLFRNDINSLLAQKAIEKLNEKKIEIASNYFGK